MGTSTINTHHKVDLEMALARIMGTRTFEKK
jgi:hypothetical protein